MTYTYQIGGGKTYLSFLMVINIIRILLMGIYLVVFSKSFVSTLISSLMLFIGFCSFMWTDFSLEYFSNFLVSFKTSEIVPPVWPNFNLVGTYCTQLTSRLYLHGCMVWNLQYHWLPSFHMCISCSNACYCS